MKLSSTLPKDDRNGLEVKGPVFVNDPDALHVVIAIVRTSKLTINLESGETEPQVRLARIEVVLPQDAPRAEQMLRRAVESRCGAAALPIDLEYEITVAFREASIDRHTGELHDGGEATQ